MQYLIGEDRDLSYYKDQATQVEYPNVAQEQNEAVAGTQEPRRIRHPRKDEIQDVSLEDALRVALQNAEVIRDNASFLNPGNRLLSNPDFASSIYDVAIQESNTLFGQGGVQAALSEFDATLTTNMTWGASEQPAESNTIGFSALDGQREEFGDFRAELSKIFGDGGSFSVEHNWLYSGVNQRGGNARVFNSQFTSRPSANQDGGLPTFGMEYRRPLWQGAGTEYTRIAGPIARRPTLQSTPTVNQGVVIARIRTDISLVEFEASVAQLLKDAEDTYWQLYLAYRTYDAESVATQSALQTWREVRANMDAGKVGAADEAQARDNYFETRSRREGALSNLFTQEVRLRRLMGLAVNDGTVLRPSDDPVTAQILPDWNNSLAESLTNRPEIRRQKWNIKSLELQRGAAEKLVNPRLDFVARYQVNGFGDKLTGGDGRFNSAYDTLMNGDHTGWGLGFEFSMPIGFRGATTQMQNIEHRISKARALLAQQEQEISYELASAFQQLDQSYQTAKTNYNRRRAAQRRVEAFEAEYKVGRSTVDLVLRAQISLAQAEIAYYSSLVGYNQALNELRYRKGTLLMDNSVYLSESLWTEDAYDDALRRAWERSFAFASPNKVTEPSEFVDDCIDCLDTANGQFDYHNAMPMEEALPPMVPGPVDPAEPAPTGIDNRSALMPSEPQTGGLSGDDEFVPEAVSQPIFPVSEPLEGEARSDVRNSVVPAPPSDDSPAPLQPVSDPFGPDDFVPPMPLDGRSNARATFKAPSTGSVSRSQLMSGASLQAASDDFAEPIETVEFSAGSSSSGFRQGASTIPAFNDEFVASEGIQQASGFGQAGNLPTAPQRSPEPVEQPEAKKSAGSWGRIWRRN
ncbi:MAG: TolC family protein [Planctomycetota bacterium]|nr:TolC family protein [Planctomycetota bacterium]MDA0920924.1 TolC family protein [Planctomycetota bacterium]